METSLFQKGQVHFYKLQVCKIQNTRDKQGDLRGEKLNGKAVKELLPSDMEICCLLNRNLHFLYIVIGFIDVLWV